MPEVEIIRKSLVGFLKTRRIKNVEIGLSRLIKWPSPTEFSGLVIGKKILDVKRRGKYLLVELENEYYIIVHLRMTGKLLYVKHSEKKDSHSRIVFYLDNDDLLVYADTRTLGTIHVINKTEIWRISGLANLGPEPLSKEFTVDYLELILANNKGKIKTLLLNQKYISGLGNIYVDEALFLAGIHPERIAGKIESAEIKKLYTAINKVIKDGLAHGGTTFRDYRNAEGEKGQHQNHLYVYGRKDKPCLNCHTFINKIEVGSRGTHFCPKCQK